MSVECRVARRRVWRVLRVWRVWRVWRVCAHMVPKARGLLQSRHCRILCTKMYIVLYGTVLYCTALYCTLYFAVQCTEHCTEPCTEYFTTHSTSLNYSLQCSVQLAVQFTKANTELSSLNTMETYNRNIQITLHNKLCCIHIH